VVRIIAVTCLALLLVPTTNHGQAQPAPQARPADGRPKQVEAPANVRCVADSFGNYSCSDGSRVIRDTFGNVMVIPGRK
jgi:hypothetical protein